MHKSSVATPKPYIKTKESSNRGIFSSNSVQEHTSFTRNSTQVNSQQAAEDVAEREFTAGEFAPGGGWEVLIAHKADAAALAA